MSDVSFRSRPSLTRALVFGLAACLLPAGAVFAQSNPRMRVANEASEIRLTRREGSKLVTTAPVGTLVEVIHVAGDYYRHLASNWYLVVLPPDPWGRRHVGWISGRYVVEAPPAATPAAAPARPAVSMTRPPQSVSAQPEMATAGFVARPPAAVAPVEPVEIPDVVVHFAFDKSDLTPEARSTLDCAMEMMVEGQAMAFGVEGHTDWSGPEAYNEKLGMARAEAVKSYLIEAHRIPLDRITVTSHGESMPAASNDTREGRAQNRRVVVKVGG